MKRYLVSYANEEFYESQKRLNKSARKYGFKVFSYTDEDILYKKIPLKGNGIKGNKKGEIISTKDYETIGEHWKPSKFYLENKQVLDTKKGGGLWLWKPFVILKAMKQIKNGDLLVYCDSGSDMIAWDKNLIELCKQQGGILLFDNRGQKNSTWTKRDVFYTMNMDKPRFWNAPAAVAGFQIYIKNKKSMAFINDYMKYCKMRVKVK